MKDKFCNLFYLSLQKNCKVKEMGITSNNSWVWQFRWKRVFNAIEMTEFLEMWKFLGRYIMNKKELDSLSWKLSDDGRYSTRSMYIALSKRVDKEEEVDPLLKKLWCKGVPSKVSSFLWKAIRDRVPTKNNLLRRGIVVDDRDKICTFCFHPLEDIGHLLCSCSFSYDVWRKCFDWLGFEMVGSNILRNHYCQFVTGQGGKTMKKMLNIIWQSVCWSIWKARNDAIFKGTRINTGDILEGVKFRSWKWLRSFFHSSFIYSLHDWCISPMSCCPIKLF